ncbi:MAG: hypothetical protein DHS20C01_37410 [marine bacterium B5-7]|nr:MAG: hypothetical protein DHS20C01_37410 [marine bacterium B5-7]
MSAFVASPENLRLAFWKARKGKSHAKEVMAYRVNLQANLVQLRNQILTGLVDVGHYRFFKIFDPKERQICASAFSEQVLHHALMNTCHDYFERVQIYDSYACRTGKGTYAAIGRAKKFTRKCDWFLKLDVRKYFNSVSHDVLQGQLARMFKDYRILEIFEKIIASYRVQSGCGLPIGNLTSQYFANHYLSGLDHYVKEVLRIKAYVRYMDDMILWHNDKAMLIQARDAIRYYVRTKLRCELKPALLNRSVRGLPFLGYVLYPHYVTLSQRSKTRFIKKMCELENRYRSGDWCEATCQRRLFPLLAFVRYADSRIFREKLLMRIQGQLA